MCLAVPAKVLKVDEDGFSAEVDVLGNSKRISVFLTPGVQAGDWVLVHAGQAISLISREEADSSTEIWEKLLSPEREVISGE